MNHNHNQQQYQLNNKKQSAEARHRHNQKRNSIHRSRRYWYFKTRSVYHRFTMVLIRKIIHQFNTPFVHN
ncbi:unnamed protein product [Adineta steineri]|uniref:Uncharacterized protein n=1 Tax=Adineta steineri TaxID=433720 RepID=A0A814WBP0_9BILA|nr:unnamed protein product [Adineta steineri]